MDDVTISVITYLAVFTLCESACPVQKKMQRQSSLEGCTSERFQGFRMEFNPIAPVKICIQ